MGAGNSKTDASTNQHVFTASTPTHFAPSLVSQLEDSPQSDSTRAATQELKIQQRLSAELEKIAAKETEELSSRTYAAASDTSSSKDAPSLVDQITGDATEKDKRAQLSRDSVSKEIEELRKKLANRRKIDKPDAVLEKAKEELVQCLRINDRRPLDCWQERDNFKKAVNRLERDFVDKTVG